MGVWIRSQRKDWLINAVEVWAYGSAVYGLSPGRADGDKCALLGEYSNGAEATAVLNKIQEFIQPSSMQRFVRGSEVFEMPAAGFLDASTSKYLCTHCGQKPGDKKFCKHCGTEKPTH